MALGLGSWLQSIPQPASSCQALYTKFLADGYREQRLTELSLKEGLAEGRISRLLQDGKVLHRNNDSNHSSAVLVFIVMTCKPIFWIGTHELQLCWCASHSWAQWGYGHPVVIANIQCVDSIRHTLQLNPAGASWSARRTSSSQRSGYHFLRWTHQPKRKRRPDLK